MSRTLDTRFGYTTVGHVTRDAVHHRTHGITFQPGGSAFYSALQAARLGLRTLIVTQGVPKEIGALLAPYSGELELYVIPAAHTTTLSVRGSGSTRTQRVLAWAGPIVEPVELDTAILHFAPIARETPVGWGGHADFVGITPQGLVRQWEQGEEVGLVQLDAPSLLGDIPLVPPDSEVLAGDISQVELDPALLPERFDAAVISEHECASCHELFSAARRCGAHVAVTAGARPTTVHAPSAGADAVLPGTHTDAIRHATHTDAVLPGTRASSVMQTPPPPTVIMRDDIGAGDVFAAAFFVALAEGRTPLQAATFGNAAAALRIAGVGPSTIGRREAIVPRATAP